MLQKLKFIDINISGMDWMCPGYSETLAQQLLKYHGNITTEVAVRDIVSIVQTGSTHIAIYDLTNRMMFVSVARADSQTGPKDAYDRSVTPYRLQNID